MPRSIVLVGITLLAAALALVHGLPAAAASGLNWTLLHPPSSPSALSGLVMAYDADRHDIVMVGSSNQSSETWTWDGNTWTLRHPANAPPGSSPPVMADDEARHQVVLYLGDAAGPQNSTWAWDGATWKNFQPATAPPSRLGAALAYDAARGVIVLFGGCCDAERHALKDTWTWDGANWTQQHVPIAPPDRNNASLAYDPAHHNVVLFGGASPTNTFGYTDTWTWDGTSWTERQANLPPPLPDGYPAPATGGGKSNGVQPPARISANLAFDPQVPGVVLFGGNWGNSLGDMWVWDGSAWSQLRPSTVQPARPSSAMAYDDFAQQLVLFGGAVTSCVPPVECGPLADTWVFGAPIAAPTVPHDNRYFAQTGFRVDNDVIWDYVSHRGGLATFGYPVSRAFIFQGFTVQFFQRRIVQIDTSGHARLLNLLDAGLLPYNQFNGSTFPAYDGHLLSTAPSSTDPVATLAYVRLLAVDSYQGIPVNFYQTFLSTVSATEALPIGGDLSLLPGFDLEMWGIPTSAPAVDPNNHNFVYLRFQRGIMHYDASCACTQGILLADYLKSILTGQGLPADLERDARGSPYFKQYDPSAVNWVHDPALLLSTDLTNAFSPE